MGGKGIQIKRCSPKHKRGYVAPLQVSDEEQLQGDVSQHHLLNVRLRCTGDWSTQSRTVCCSSLSQAFKHGCVFLLTTYLRGGAETARNGSVNSGQVFLQSLQGSLFFFFLSPPLLPLTLQPDLFYKPLSNSLGDTEPVALQKKKSFS